MQMTVTVALEQLKADAYGTPYRVYLEGDVLIARTHDPEHQAARVLKDRGLCGTLITITFGGDGSPRARVDIEGAAQWTMVETSQRGPCSVPYRKLPAMS